ncbi:MAG: IPTL-CTERM sorting domain-containing protein, partial [Burkholderiaceae bacterium]|nr:IPTL-CTERM sorting domain-containing protein [Burkholderiaceae bacterium]
TLTIAGNYAGSGQVSLDVRLGDDTSPADTLHITGDAGSGTTVLQVSNLLGTGAATTGDGILVVQVDGASTGTFALQGGSVQAGNWRYTLARGSGANASNWYLKSTFLPPIPTLGALGLGALAALLGATGLLRRRRI